MHKSLKKYSQIYDKASPEELKDILPYFTDEVVFKPDGIKIALYDQPTDKGLFVNHKGDGAPECIEWLPERTEYTNFFPVDFMIILKNVWDEKRYFLSDDVPLEKIKRNPILEAQKLEALFAKNHSYSKAKLARKLRISRARITQILQLLDLDPQIQNMVLASKNRYSERQLRPLTRVKSFEKQRELFLKICP